MIKRISLLLNMAFTCQVMIIISNGGEKQIGNSKNQLVVQSKIIWYSVYGQHCCLLYFCRKDNKFTFKNYIGIISTTKKVFNEKTQKDKVKYSKLNTQANYS